jgi:transposase
MIVPSGAVRVLVATRPVDFRKGMDGLAALVRESLGSDPFSGVIYVFRAKRADRVKLLLWDGTGLVLVAKRLEKSSFRWPRISDGVMRLTSSQLSALLEGLDWTRVRAVRVPAPQATLSERHSDSDARRGATRAAMCFARAAMTPGDSVPTDPDALRRCSWPSGRTMPRLGAVGSNH